MEKKITFFIGSLEEGGAERVVSYLSSYLVDCAYDVSLILYHERDLFYQIDKRVEIITVTKETGSTNVLKNIRWLRKYFTQKSSVVVSFLAVFNMMALISLIGTHTPIIVADRNDPYFVPSKLFLRVLRNFLYRFANGIVLQTKHNKDYFSACIRNKSVVINNPIDLGAKRGAAIGAEKKDEIVSVGRLMPQKNQTMLIRVFFEIHKKYPSYKLVIYGEGPMRSELEALITSLDLHDSVLLPGSEKDIFEKICHARIFVLSSDYEGMPNALAEAMCLGLPCISTAVSGATDMIENEKNGLLIEKDCYDDLHNALLRLLEDRDFADRLGEKALNLNCLLDKSIIAEQWKRYILGFCGQASHASKQKKDIIDHER